MALSRGFFFGVDVLGWALLHFLWQGAALGLIYWLVRPLCTGVAARYRLGMGILLALTLCPLLTMTYLWPAAGASGVATMSALPLLAGTITAVADHAVSSWRYQQMLPWLVAGWMCGVLVIALRSLWQWRRLARLVLQASPLPDWEVRLVHLCDRFGLLRPVRLLCSASAVTPMLIGWLKPVILLPASMLSGFSPHQIELILAHELGHVRRWDYLANLLQVVIETVLFYHPVVHWISRDVRNARENCCDDLVLSVANGNPLTYARALANLEALRHEQGAIAPALGASGGVLLTRIRRIVGAAEVLDPLPRSNAWPLLLAIAALVCLAWRPQHSVSDLTVPGLTVALSNAPTHTLALVSGNPRLANPAAAAASISPPVVTANITAAAAVVQHEVETAATPEPVSVRIARPRVSLAMAGAIDRVRNIATVRPAMPTTLSLAELDSAASSAAPATKLAPLHIVAPVYPSRAMSAATEGKVELEFGVGVDGGVRDIRVLHAQPAGVFDAAAIAALSEWRFPSAQSAERYTQNFAFTLHGRGIDGANAKCQQTTGTLICRRPGE